MGNYIQVVTTFESKEDAERIADALVEKRLGACIQILGPMTSVYRWKGKVEKTTEFLCQVKTRASLYLEVEKTIKGLHPYTTPEIIALPILEAHSDYAAWMDQETTR